MTKINRHHLFKQKIYRIIEKGSHGSRKNLIFDYFIMTLIILNVLALIIETHPEIKESIGDFLHIFEICIVFIFTIEYLMRIYIADISHPSSNRIKSRMKFIFSTFGIIDLLSIIPFFMPMLIRIDLRFLRIFRIMRFFRIFKITRYNSSLNLIYSVIKEKRAELAMTWFVGILILIVASFLMFEVEGEVQPDKFPNIISCFWWAIATMTTVGYGDVFPITAMGKILSGVLAVLGIGLAALPTGIISAGFIEKIGKDKKRAKKCPHCGKDLD